MYTNTRQNKIKIVNFFSVHAEILAFLKFKARQNLFFKRFMAWNTRTYATCAIITISQ